MMTEALSEIISGIEMPDVFAMDRARARWDSLAMPLGSLGLFQEMVVRMAGVFKSEQIVIKNRVLVVFCADNGVVRQGVSQSDHTVTAAVARALGEGTSTASYLAACAGCRVIPVDIGMCPHPPFAGVEDRCVRAGTGDITRERAMSPDETVRALMSGIGLAKQLKSQGAELLLAGEMGIGNTATACACTCALFKLEPSLMAGPGAGLSSAGLNKKIRVIEQALAFHRPNPEKPLEILSMLGGADIAALTGLCLGGACYHLPVLLDGVITQCAAALAVKIAPACRGALLASHQSSEPSSARLLDFLQLDAPLHAGMHLGEGSGALMTLPLLDSALALYHSGHTFNQLGIEAYRRSDQCPVRSQRDCLNAVPVPEE